MDARRVVAIAIAAALLVAAGCGSSAGPTTTPSTLSTSTPDVTVTVPESFNDQLLKVNRDVPEFGGFFASADGSTLVVYMTDMSISLAPLKASILRHITTFPVATDAVLKPIKGKYTWLQLTEWYNLAEDHVWALGATHSGMDPGNNRFLVDAADQTSFDAIKRELTALGVPEDAADVEIKAAPVPD